jgi:hypothetical protein
MVRSRQEKAQTTGMVAIHPYSRIAGLITSTPITRIKSNHNQIKQEHHHLTAEQIDVDDRDCERQWGWINQWTAGGGF